MDPVNGNAREESGRFVHPDASRAETAHAITLCTVS
jgi:hypothetical protein